MNGEIKILHFKYLWMFQNFYINPIDPAVKPTIRKNANSVKSLGIELTMSPS